MGFDPDRLPVVIVFRGKTLNGLTRMAIAADSVPTEYQRVKTLRDELDISSTGFQNNREQAVAYGFLNP